MAISVPTPSDAARLTERLGLEARRHDLVTEVAHRLAGRCGVPGGSKVVVGVSGGPDSVALLLAVAALGDRRSRRAGPLFEPLAVHVNHHLRESADGDESFVTDLCRRFGIPLHTRHVYPDRQPGNTPANARVLRYEQLESVARETAAGVVAVAHHADDQLETLLMALGRGAGIDGLTGMHWRRPLGSVALVRPLLAVRKATCEAFCHAAGVEWREDPSNADSLRGRLRRDVLSVFEELWPDAATRASRTADLLDAARAALYRQLQETFGEPRTRCWPRRQIRELPIPVIGAGLRRAAEAAAPQVVDALGGAGVLEVAEAVADDIDRPRRWDWPGGLRVHVTAREIRLETVSRASDDHDRP